MARARFWRRSLWVGLAALVLIGGSSMWWVNRFRKSADTPPAVLAEAPAEAQAAPSLPALDQAVPAQTANATFSLG